VEGNRVDNLIGIDVQHNDSTRSSKGKVTAAAAAVVKSK